MMPRSRTLGMALLLTLVGAVTAPADEAGEKRARAAQAFRAKGEPVTPAPDGTIFCEAEEFRVETPGWQAGGWGENYYAATFANTFLSRKAFLGAPAVTEKETAAAINVDIKDAGRYLVLVRYEAAYRFETQFKVKVEQAGKIAFDRGYGARKNPKIWAFGSKVKDEVGWDWGAVENVVWEGHDAFVDLQPGTARITLVAGPQGSPPAKRNVDLIMLTRDVEQVKMRIEKEGYLPLDGMLTQAGEVFMRVENAGAAPVKVSSQSFSGGPMHQHSPYWVHLRTWKPVSVDVEAKKTSEWIDVGGTMDSLNDGQWGFQASGPCRITLGIKDASGRITASRTFDAQGPLSLVSWADARYGQPFQTPAEANQELFSYVKGLKLPNTQLKKIYVHATGGLPREFYDFYGLNGAAMSGPKGYVDLRQKSPAKLDELLQKMPAAEKQNMLVVSLGDEIGLPQPRGPAATEGFVAFLKSQRLEPSQVDPAAGADWAKVLYSTAEPTKAAKPALYYWSQRYLYAYGIQQMKALTDVLKKHLPNAHIGANFSPHHGGGEHSYLGEVFKWVSCFRDDGMTLPWAEDYIWQVPVGTPQMNGINLDMFRAGNRGKPNRRILYYVMPHMPGNTPNMWRRLWHNAIGHGATILNLFEFDPVWAAYTENHVTGREMYAEVLRGVRELATYEDIVHSGQVRPARTALWFSETGDIWRDNRPSFGAAKRGLYVAIQNRQLPLDFVVEADATGGGLGAYDVLYLTDNHVSRAASARIADWVKAGGTLFATAGAGMFDETNQPNTVLREVLGVAQSELVMPADQQIAFIKQDLNFRKPLDHITLESGATKLPAFGVVSRFTPGKGVNVLGTFADGSPAVVANAAGKGKTMYCGFLPSLSYFKPAIPMVPVDRGGTDDAMAHFLPTDYDAAAGRLIGSAAEKVVRPVLSEAPLVETNVIESPAGTAILATNWSGKPIPRLVLTITMPVKTGSVTLASGGKVEVKAGDGRTTATFDLDVADTLILR